MCCAALLLFIAHNRLSAQRDSLKSLAVGIDFISSGNTHGGYLRLFAGVERRRHLFTAGPMIQLGSGYLNGGRISYSRNLSAAPERSRPDKKGRYRYDRVQLNLGTFLQYIHNAPMAPYVIANEELTRRGDKVAFETIRLSTAEIGVGIDLRLNITHHFCWFGMAATSTHYHIQYNPAISRERMALTLGLASGFLYVFE